MKKIISSIFILLVISIVACQQSVKKEEVMKKTETPAQTPKIETTGDAAVDAVGKDLSNINDTEKDLSSDDLSDLDSGLSDVQNI